MNERHIQLEHGGGGRLSRELIERIIVPRFGQGPLAGLPDAASLPLGAAQVVFSTDSYVVSPLEFPGGSIGDLAVYGSVNDVAVAGGRPLWLSVGLILEEGLPMAVLEHTLDDLASAADSAGVTVVTGDTKVVERGKCDGLFINTACIGEALPEFNLSTACIRPGDVVLANGTLGDHGMAIMAARTGLTSAAPESDTASVWPCVEALRQWGDGVRFMRDPTRGGTAAVLNEIVSGTQQLGIVIDESQLPVSSRGRAVSEILGIDLLHSACEGRVIAVVSPGIVEKALAAWHPLPAGRDAAVFGRVTDEKDLHGTVAAETLTGGRRIVDVPRGELLPRIC